MHQLLFLRNGDHLKKVGDYVVYRKDVCKVADIKKKYHNDLDYYRLVPIDDESLHVDIPINNEFGYLRDLISKEEAERIISKMPEIETLKCDDKMLENEYKELINSASLEDYVKIIKTTYLRMKEREENKKKICEKDNYYFNLAEKYLYNEFSIILNKNYEETKQYIIDKVASLN